MRTFIAALSLLVACPAFAAGGDPVSLTMRAGGIDVHRGLIVTRVTALTDNVLRVTIAPTGAMPEDASWAVDHAIRAEHVTIKPLADGFETTSLRVRFARDTGRMRVETLDGRMISADAGDPVVAGTAFTLRKAMPLKEHYFGLGDKTGGLDRRGQSFVNWNTDAFGFGGATDPIYKSIPFFISIGGEGGSYGIFLDNSWRSWFDFGHREADILTFGADNGPIDYYVIVGPATADVVRRYTQLTGKAPLAPLWALGYQQSRYSYMSAAEVRQIAARLRSDRFPTDVIWLDIDYQEHNRPFTVNPRTFPDIKGLIGDLSRQGFKTVTITDLHVAKAVGQGYAPYDTGTAEDRFVHNPDGSVYVAPVWPGPSVFPEFTDAKARAWWGSLFAQEVADGVAGSWNDMNEPAIFDTPTKTMPIGTRHRIASDDFISRTATHAEIHNVYGMENTRATYDGLRRLRPDERAFVMTRASYAGGQRYAVTWTGDNSATWDHLKLSVQQIINLGLSGFSYSAADVSGFAGGPSADLLTRWFEIGAFYPIFRNHSATGTPRVEPWVDGPAQLAIRRRFVEERYRLMPYLYALADQNARTGDPILRPVFYDYPDALDAPCDQSWTFTLGGRLLIAPPPAPESPQRYNICLPAGGWYDYWTGLPVHGRSAGGGPIQSATQTAVPPRHSREQIEVTPRLDSLPVFVRGGSIIPRQSLVQNTAEKPAGPLILDVYPGTDCVGTLYADDGHSMGYMRGGFARQTVRCSVTASGLTIDFERREGKIAPWWSELKVVVHAWPGKADIRLSGKPIAYEAGGPDGSLTFELTDSAERRSVRIVR